jgi:hypothetical protein
MVLHTDGEVVSGTYDGEPIENGRFKDGQLAYTAQLTKPFRIKIKIKSTAMVDGDTMTGTGKAAIMSIPFNADRTR